MSNKMSEVVEVAQQPAAPAPVEVPNQSNGTEPKPTEQVAVSGKESISNKTEKEAPQPTNGKPTAAPATAPAAPTTPTPTTDQKTSSSSKKSSKEKSNGTAKPAAAAAAAKKQQKPSIDEQDDVDIVVRSNGTKEVDDYLLHRGRLSELSFSFLHTANANNQEGLLKRQMIICENEPAELPKDVIRSETKLDDGLDQLNLNLSNIRQRFERGSTGSEDSVDGSSQPSSAGVVIEKPSFDIKQFRKAFESPTAALSAPTSSVEKPVPKKLGNLNGFFNRSSQGSEDLASPPATATKPLPIKRSESLMMRLKKYESRIAGEQVVDDDESGSDADDINDKSQEAEVKRPIGKLKLNGFLNGTSNGTSNGTGKLATATYVPKTLNLSTLKIQWETGDIKNRRLDEDEDDEGVDVNGQGENGNNGTVGGGGADSGRGQERQEELFRIRQQLARGRKGSVKNIYENAIKEAQQQAAQSQRRPSDEHLSVLNGLSTSDIQQQLLQQTNGQSSAAADSNGSSQTNRSSSMKSPPSDIEQIRLSASRKANKLREKFELGLVSNSSRGDSDQEDSDGDGPGLTKLEQIRQEKLEDLSIFTEGEIVAREARNIFQQMDRKISASSNGTSNGRSNRAILYQVMS